MGGRWIEDLLADVKFALRQLRRAPGFTFVAIVTLALGLGANSAIFALVDRALLRPLPLPDADRLVAVWETTEGEDRGLVSPLNMIDFGARAQSLQVVAGFAPSVGGMVLANDDGTTENVPRQWVTSGIFDALGVRPIAGRTFTADDRDGVAVMSEGFWRSRFNADPSVVGRQLRLDGDPFLVVGVVPDEARLIGETSIWAVAGWDATDPRLRFPRVLQAVGRLRPGVSVDTAQAELAAVAADLQREYPRANAGRGAALEPFADVVVGADLRLTSMLFLGVVGFVLLICCANVASLLLARATARERELAVRAAIGASPRRIVRQLLTESLVLSIAGGLVGLAVGAAILEAAPSFVPAGLLPDAMTLAIDWRIAAFAGAAALFVGVLFGLMPAWQVRGLSPANAGSTRSTSARGGRVRTLLTIGAVAAATVLLCGAGLLLRTLLALGDVDRGYRADHVLTLLVDPLGSEYPTPETLQGFYDAVEAEVRALPGVRSAAWASTLPLGTSYAGTVPFEIVGDPPADPDTLPEADYQVVSHGYFDTVDLPVVAGRAFSDRDRRDAAPVAIVNEAFAERYFAGRPAVGARIALRMSSSAPPVVREVVGVARQVKQRPDATDPFLQIYVPMPQSLMGDIFLLVRSDREGVDALTPSVRAAIGRVDRAQLVGVRDIETLDEVRAGAMSRHRFRAALVLLFAAIALLLAMIGVFGILTAAVQQRVREIGVRVALGAGLGDVLGLVGWRALRVVGAGLAIGLVLAAASGRLVASVLYGVSPFDPVTFLAVALLLALTAALASAAPAWRAARIDPAVAMRAE